MLSRKKCKNCGHFEPAKSLPGRGWCRYHKVDPANIGSRKLEYAGRLGCREHRPLWWMSKKEWQRRQWIEQGGMLFLQDEP